MSSADLLARLQRHYIKPGAPLPGGVFLPEVGVNGSWGAAGRCDAIYVGFTSTSGRILVGHELKISRSDWLHELNSPGKADAWCDACHEWWLVVADPAIVHDGELPAGWGLMAPGTSKTRMKVLSKPDRKLNHDPPWQAVRSVMARQDTLRAQAIADVRACARAEAERDFQAEVNKAVAARMAHKVDTDELRTRMALIEQALGGPVRFDSPDDAKRAGRRRGAYYYGAEIGMAELQAIGEVVRQNRDLDNAVRQLTDGYALDGTRRALERLESAIKGLRAAPGQQMELDADA